MLQQLRGRGALLRVAIKAPFQKIDAGLAELLRGRELRRVALRNVVHDGPFVVEGGPGPAAGRHLEDDAAEGPDVDGAGAPGVLAFDDFGRHVHWGAGHGFVGDGLVGVAGVAAGVVLADEGFALAGDDFGGAEVDVFDYTVVIEKNVCGRG